MLYFILVHDVRPLLIEDLFRRLNLGSSAYLFLLLMIILWFLRFVEIFPTQYEKGKINIRSASIFQNYFSIELSFKNFRETHSTNFVPAILLVLQEKVSKSIKKANICN